MSLILALASFLAKAQDIRVDYRPRAPEMIVIKQNNHYSGPLVEVTRKMVRDSGFTLQENHRNFGKSLKHLKNGVLDILPRTFCTKERLNSINYIGPIGYQDKIITFIVRKGDENKIKSYDDLKQLKIGIKKGAVYFKKFDSDHSLFKMESLDDENMVKMLFYKRFDTMIVQDQKASNEAIKRANLVGKITNAKYHHFKRSWNYFGVNKNFQYAEKLQSTLESLIKSGYVKNIYKQFSMEAPILPQDGVLPKCENIAR